MRYWEHRGKDKETKVSQPIQDLKQEIVGHKRVDHLLLVHSRKLVKVPISSQALVNVPNQCHGRNLSPSKKVRMQSKRTRPELRKKLLLLETRILSTTW